MKQDYPLMLMADHEGRIFEHPFLLMAGASGVWPQAVVDETVAPLPPYSKVFYLPGCPPVGLDPSTGESVTVRTFQKRLVSAVASFLPPGFLRSLLPAADWSNRKDPLPLWAYSAVGWTEHGFASPFLELEKTDRWNPENYDDTTLDHEIEEFRKRFPSNRLVEHLSNCASEYHCFAAKNLFWSRWEAPLPVSRKCNARCIGCLSLQPSDGCTASHDRISFTPTVKEIVTIAVNHLETAEEPIVSFGQGCEGEPLTEIELLTESIREIRNQTTNGVINLNTNGYSVDAMMALADAGLDSARISLASVRHEIYDAYHRPFGFDLSDVIEALRGVEEAGVFTMINYLVFPGVSDQPEEMDALVAMALDTHLKFIHLKNLNIDPSYYLSNIGAEGWAPGVGIEKVVDLLRLALPDTRLGYFNQWGLCRRENR